MTKQEIFDRAVAGLASQGFKRSGNGSICQYRSDDACRRCAVGWLIPDEKYQQAWEGTAIASTILFDAAEEYFAAEKRKQAEILNAAGIELDRDVVDFVSDLQSAHDEAYGYDDDFNEVDQPAQMRKALTKLANDNGLTIPEVLNG